jgi:hypothetical protein
MIPSHIIIPSRGDGLGWNYRSPFVRECPASTMLELSAVGMFQTAKKSGTLQGKLRRGPANRRLAPHPQWRQNHQ